MRLRYVVLNLTCYLNCDIKELYNDIEEERASFDQRFWGMSREELVKTARIWGLEQESIEGSLDTMAEDKLRVWVRNHAPL